MKAGRPDGTPVDPVTALRSVPGFHEHPKIKMGQGTRVLLRFDLVWTCLPANVLSRNRKVTNCAV